MAGRTAWVLGDQLSRRNPDRIDADELAKIRSRALGLRRSFSA